MEGRQEAQGMGQRPEDMKRRAGRRLVLKDWVGRTFGGLTVVSYDGRRGGKHYWRCRCLCGGEAVVSQSNLQDGHTRSCGCLSDPAGTRHFVEGTCIESIRSRRVSASNRSGIRGVYENKRTGRFAAQITFQGRTRYLGSFGSLEEAARARAEAERVFDEFLERHGDARGAEGAAGRQPLLEARPASGTGMGAEAGDACGAPQTAEGRSGKGAALTAAAGGAYGQELSDKRRMRP